MNVFLIVLAALGGLSVFINVLVLIAALVFILLLHRDSRELVALGHLNAARLASIDKLSLMTYTMLQADMLASGAPAGPTQWSPVNIEQRGGKYVTEDGRHEAASFEELMGKLSNDPRYRVARDEDIEKLRQQFEDHAAEEDEGEEWNDEPQS